MQRLQVANVQVKSTAHVKQFQNTFLKIHKNKWTLGIFLRVKIQYPEEYVQNQNCSIFGNPALRLMIFCRGDLHIIILWVAAIPCRLHFKACQSTIGLNQTQGPKVNPNNTLLRTCLLLTYCSGATFGGEGRWNLHDSWTFHPLQFTHRPVARIVFAPSSPCESMMPRCHAVAPPPPQTCGSLPWRHGTLPATCLPAWLPRAALPLRLQQARREGLGIHLGCL